MWMWLVYECVDVTNSFGASSSGNVGASLCGSACLYASVSLIRAHSLIQSFALGCSKLAWLCAAIEPRSKNTLQRPPSTILNPEMTCFSNFHISESRTFYFRKPLRPPDHSTTRSKGVTTTKYCQTRTLRQQGFVVPVSERGTA